MSICALLKDIGLCAMKYQNISSPNFGGAASQTLSGRSFPVDRCFLLPQLPYLALIAPTDFTTSVSNTFWSTSASFLI